jgi:hypothetical protein
MAVKKQKTPVLVPNPLHKFASYTYSWSLWWLDNIDYNQLMSKKNAIDALNFNPGPNSFVIAQDGGTYPNRRQPGTLGLNYHIQSVQLETVVAPSKNARSSNVIEGSMTIIEPYGVTLIDTLIAASFDGVKYNSYLDRPFMLQLDFKGYDDNGNELPLTETATYRKRFPIRMLEFKVDVTNRGTEYKLTFRPKAHQSGFGTQYNISQTPKDFTITAGTVEEFFNGPSGLAKQYADFFKSQIDKQGRTTLADAVRFNIDPTIAESKIVNESKVSLTKSSAKSSSIDLKSSTFTIPRGTPVLDIIDKVMAHSDYLVQLQLGLEGRTDLTDTSDTNVFNAFKTTVNEQIAGVDTNGKQQSSESNPITGRYPVIVTFNIAQYALWSSVHPATYRTMFSNSNPYTQKFYDYYYTGKNIDIVDLKINFDTTYFKSILNFTSVKAAEDSSPDNEIDRKDLTSPAISLTPGVLTRLVPQLGQVPNLAPPTYKFVVGDRNITSGMNIMDRSAAQITADVIQSIYTNRGQDMINVDITIVGDPTLLKQDDWLYIPDPREATDHSDWSSVSISDYSAKHGHLPMDRSEIIVRLTVNSPIDMDIDIPGANQGLAYPNPRYSQSLFSGQYRILNVKSTFANGKFEQVLALGRIINSDYTTAAFGTKLSDGRESNNDPVADGTNIDAVLVPTNATKPIGDYDPDNVSNEPLPIDTSIPYDSSETPSWTVNVTGNARE